MKKLISIAAMAMSMGAAAQQDIHFSQYYTSPLFVNPATTGMFEGDLRAMTNYRNQWTTVGAPFSTISGSVDMPIFSPKNSDDFFSLGGTFFNDKAGDSKFKTTSFGLNTSYALSIARDQYISAGLYFGVMQRAITPGSLTWDSQWDGTTFNTSYSSNESVLSGQFTTFEMSGGICYTYLEDDMKLQGGVGIHHFNRPSINFMGGEEKLMIRYLFHAGGEIRLGRSNVAIVPNAMMFFQGPNFETGFGTDFKFIIKEASKRLDFNDEISFSTGMYLRLMDAIYPTFRFNYAGLSVGGAYDLTISRLAPATKGLGAFELFLQYRFAFGVTGSGVSSFR
jgi:type IX secretion system PorP/SprF family membrane protein